MRASTEKLAEVRLLQQVVRIIKAEPRYQSVVRRVLAAERLYSKEAVSATEKAIMRFRTATMLFFVAIDKGAAFRTVQRRFREVLSLPGCNLHSNVAVHINFAGYCEDQGKTDLGIRRLERLEAKLNRLEGRARPILLANCRREVALMLSRLRKEQKTQEAASHARRRQT